MALVDADYKFVYVDIGAQGRISDGGVFNNCKLSKRLQNNTLNLPKPEVLPGTDLICPFMIIADDAFPLKTYLMKPYSSRGMQKSEIIFNYRLSRARRTVENAFGQMANRFRIFRAPMIVKTSTARRIVLACTALHNFIRVREGSSSDITDTDEQQETSERCQVMTGLAPLRAAGGTGRLSNDAKALRDQLANYFLTDGSVAWQETMAGYNSE